MLLGGGALRRLRQQPLQLDQQGVAQLLQFGQARQSLGTASGGLELAQRCGQGMQLMMLALQLLKCRLPGVMDQAIAIQPLAKPAQPGGRVAAGSGFRRADRR